MIPGLNLDLVRAILAVCIALALAVLGAVVLLTVARGVPLDSQRLIGLLLAVGTLVSVLGNLLGTRQVAGDVRSVKAVAEDTQAKVNGHVDAHLGHTDQEVRQIVHEQLGELGVAPPPGPQGG